MKHLKIYEEYKVHYDDIPHNGLEITVKGFEFAVEGDYDGGEEAIMYEPDGTGYPGDGSSYDITKLYGFDEDGEEYTIYSIDDKKNLDYKSKNVYDESVSEYLKNEYGVTFDDIERTIIESIED